jgi:hypothetical protein
MHAIPSPALPSVYHPSARGGRHVMTPDLDRFLADSARYALRVLGATSPSRRPSIAQQAASQADARRTLEQVVGDGFTWPELVALELIRREEDGRRRRRQSSTRNTTP